MGKNGYIKKYDPKERRLYVWPVLKVSMVARRGHPKEADLDEVFARKGTSDENQDEAGRGGGALADSGDSGSGSDDCKSDLNDTEDTTE